MNALDLELHYSATNYKPLPVTFVRGQGAYLYDADEREYLDMLGAYSAASFGHCNSRLTHAVIKQLYALDITSRAVGNDRLGEFLARACVMTGMDRAVPMNSGAEAVETAIKLARKWAYVKPKTNIAIDEAEIITFDGNFHGRTTTVVSFSTNTQYNRLFGPLTPGFRTAQFGDLPSVRRVMNKKTAAVLVEPIQGEGGIVVPPPGFLADLQQLCRANDVLLICDEVQTGMGRTGKLLACWHDGVQPDMVCMGKALGGGFYPVSLVLGRDEIMSVFEPGDHGSTFGGNPIAAALGFEALGMLIDERLIERAAVMGKYFKQKLLEVQNWSHPKIKEVRGKGLLLGVELLEGWRTAEKVVDDLLEEGVLTKNTHRNTIRFAPPLDVTEEQIVQAVDKLRRVLA